MIINTTYFKGDIYLPHAKPGISDSITDVESKVVDFINEYDQDCLEKCLGIRLATEFFNKLDSSTPTFIKVGEDVKWNRLLNGHTYTKANGDVVVWKGIRRGTVSLGEPVINCKHDKSFLADYVYFYYESNSFITRGDAGSGKNKSANSETVMPNFKVTKAWRSFFNTVQGDNTKNTIVFRDGILGGYGVDYFYGQDQFDATLYQFIRDTNELVADTYINFNPKDWGQINQFTI